MPSRSWTDLTPVPAAEGEWIAARLGRWGTVAGLVGEGFDSYAVIPHRADRAGEAPPDTLNVELAAALRSVVAGVGQDAGSGFVTGVWEGHGGLTHGGVRISLESGESGESGESWEVPPALGREVLARPRLQLPHRGYLLFEAGLEDLAPLDLDGGALGTLSPDLFWPDDRAWLVGSDTDLVSTFIAGPAAVVARVVERVAGARCVVPADTLEEWDERTLIERFHGEPGPT